FIHRSVMAVWRGRIPIAVLGLVLITALGVGASIYRYMNNAQVLADASRHALQSDPEKGVRLAVAAVDQWSAKDSWDALRGALRPAHQRFRLQPAGAKATINAAWFGNDPYTVVTASADGNARVWAIDAYRLDPTRALPSGSPPEPAPRTTVTDPEEPGREISQAALSPSGTRLVPPAGFTATVWDMNGRSIATLDHGWLVNSATFGCNDGLVLTGDRHGTARLWNVDTGSVMAL